MTLVYLFALSGAFLLAVGLVLQPHVAAEVGSAGREVSARLLIERVRRPVWLAGIVCMAGETSSARWHMGETA